MESSIILKPITTEKASALQMSGVYVFQIAKSANKPQVEKEIFEKYKVKPIKVNIVNVRPKVVLYRGRMGHKSGFKKALVYLKEGDKIDVAK